MTDVTGTHDFVYDSTKPWRLSAEAFDTFYGSRLLAPTYESTLSTDTGVTSYTGHTLGSVPGRLSGVKLGSSGTPADDLEFAYAASNAGRFAGLVAKRDNGAASRQFVYGYETNSALVKSLAVVSNAFFVTRDFEANRDLLTKVETKWSSTTRTRYDYAYDDRRLRQSVVQSGDVFADYGGTDSGAIHQIFTYNARGEVTAGATFLGATATDQSTPLSARKHEFDYDGIGNRKWSNTSGSSGLKDNYTVNELNQYTGRENNTLALGGVADTDALVAARSSALAGRAGKHWGDNITVENWLASFSGNLKIYAVKPGTGGAAYAYQTLVRTAFLPPAAQSFAYDADGNLTNDGVWAYSWDAENRLTAMETTAGAVMGGMTAQRLEFKYDYLHRRVEKLVRGGWNGTTYATITAQRRYLYDGWSLLAEFSVSGTTLTKVRTYAWGLDIARSMKDAGGVGALLQIRDHASGKDYFPSYDGNGNIAALFDASDGSVGAAYEYSPYGEFLRCEGAYAKENPFRFSTKFTDDETGLVYYGKRYYDPANGRFLGRDPKMEKGGLNLYGFCRNDGVNRWDVLGMLSLYADGGSADDDMFKSPGPGWGQWAFGKWGWGYYNDPNDMRSPGLDPDILSDLLNYLSDAPQFAAAGNYLGLGKGSKPASSTTPAKWDAWDMLRHYWAGGGNVTLQQIGLLETIQKSSVTQGVQNRFGDQISNRAAVEAAKLAPGTHKFTHDFKNSYDFTADSWGIGSATLSGQFTGTITVNEDGSFSFEGAATISFYDKFTDPYDIFNLTKGEWNPNGTPYYITGSWGKNYSGGGAVKKGEDDE